jgi:hypothetical protein
MVAASEPGHPVAEGRPETSVLSRWIMKPAVNPTSCSGISPNDALGDEVLGEVPPLAAGAEDGEDGVDDVPRVGHAGSPAGEGGDAQLDQAPSCVGDVAGVVCLLTHHSTHLDPLKGQTLRKWRMAQDGCVLARDIRRDQGHPTAL